MASPLCPVPRNFRLPAPPRPRRPSWAWALVAVLASDMLVQAVRSNSEPTALPAHQFAEEAPLLITSDDDAGPVRRRIPAPGKGSKLWANAPCTPPHKPISGYCWAALDPADYKPPCTAGLYEHEGRCFAPISKAQRPDSSIGR